MTTTAKNYTKGRQGHTIQILVLHTAENQELPGQAVHLGQWFAGASAPQASAHEMIDNKVVVTSVDDVDTAWSDDDFPINLVSKNYEMTGHASNTKAQWADAYETSVIKLTEGEFKKDMKKYGIPAHHLTDAEIVKIHNGDKTIKGICTHADISRALKIAGGHQDPGINFPMTKFIGDISK
jgi:hypothetical protein